MSSTQLAAIEDELKRLAESLAALNLEQNEILVDTEKAQDQIQLLRSRLDKKRKLLEQESSDKLLMEERLLAAQRKNDLLRTKSNSDRQSKHEQAEKPLAVAAAASQPSLAGAKREQLPRVGPGPQEQESSYYNNSSKGEYQPPLLFADTPQPQETGKADEDEEDILARIRRNMDTE